MRHRRFVMFLLGLGVIGGYGSGIAHLACMRHHWQDHQQQMMNQFAHTCVEAARAGNVPPPPPAQFVPGQNAPGGYPYGYGPGQAPPYAPGPWGWNR